MFEYETLMRLIFAVLTIYRLARMIASDDGPLFLFKRLRYWAKDRAYYEALTTGQVIDDRHFSKWHNLAEGLSCPYCIGVWLSLPAFALVL